VFFISHPNSQYGGMFHSNPKAGHSPLVECPLHNIALFGFIVAVVKARFRLHPPRF
jgi:hypothetical protein